MTSSSLTLLRGIPDEQAAVYNTYLPQAAKVRQNISLSGVGKAGKLQPLIQTAQSSLQDLQQQANSAEKAIRAAALSTETPDQACMDKVRYAMSLGLDIPDICQGLVQDNDIGGFLALQSLIPWLARASRLPNTRKDMSASAFERAIKDTRDQVLAYQKQLMTPAQLTQLQELEECDISMPLVRQNFQQLQDFFQGQTLPGAVSGLFTRVSQLYRWQGLPGDQQTKGYLTLTDDADSRSQSAPYMVQR